MNDLCEFVKTHYREAVITVCWKASKAQSVVDNQKAYRELIFASIEFIPKYFGAQVGLKEHGEKFKDERLFHIRYVMKPREALDWYVNGHNKGFVSMPWDSDEKRIYFKSEGSTDDGMVELLPIPDMLFAEDLPFIARNWRKAQCIHYLPMSNSEHLYDVLSKCNAWNWISSCLCFDFKKYSEYLGSVNLIFPNPYYCHLHIRRVRDGNKLVKQVELLFDQDCSQKNLRVFVGERFNAEYTAITERYISNQKELIDVMDPASAIGYVVLDSQGRIWDRMDYAPPIRSIVGSIGAVGKMMKFDCKDKSTQILPRVAYSGMTVESPYELSPIIRLSDRMNAAISSRRLDQVQLSQKLFFSEGAVAEKNIRALINKATHRVIIVDPYFDHGSSSMYLAAANVPIRVLCADGGLKDGDKNGKKLLEIVNQLRKNHYQIDIRVSNHKKLHDRFLVIDDEAWLLGSSLRTIGDSLSMMIKLNCAVRVIEFIEDCFKKYGQKTLEAWISSRN